MTKSDIALIGLAVMGQNLALNIARNGYHIMVYNRTPEKTKDFLETSAKSKSNIRGAYSLEELVSTLKKPRKIMLMVKAGDPVDIVIDQLVPLLEKGDIIIDGGNSYFKDTIKRTKELDKKGIHFMGVGVSGGEEGALKGPIPSYEDNKSQFIEDIKKALYASKICSYAQGFDLMAQASKTYNWNLNLGNIALLWRGGCIIRAQFLDKIKQAYEENPKLQNLLLAPYFKQSIEDCQRAWRNVVSTAASNGIPIPSFSSALAYYDSYRMHTLPANLIQAQRDYFGAHNYERIDKDGIFHTIWV